MLTFKAEQAIGAMLRTLRQRRGYSVCSLARLVGIAEHAYERVETGVLDLTGPELGRICYALGATPELVGTLVLNCVDVDDGIDLANHHIETHPDMY